MAYFDEAYIHQSAWIYSVSLSWTECEKYALLSTCSTANLRSMDGVYFLNNPFWRSSMLWKLPVCCPYNSSTCTQSSTVDSISGFSPLTQTIYYEPNKFCCQAAECGRPLRAANRHLPALVRSGGGRQTPVPFTEQAVPDLMLQTVIRLPSY